MTEHNETGWDTLPQGDVRKRTASLDEVASMIMSERADKIYELRCALASLADETRTACDARKFPSLTTALAVADAVMAWTAD